ncbi:MAG: P1 family peptidase [Thermomicrobiales bacterium]
MSEQGTTSDARDDITDVSGVRAGHWTDREGLTGCTVVLAEGGAAAAVDVRGAAPGTRETDALGLGRTVERIHAVLLTGGSAFGLAAADGVMQWLRERGTGHPMREGPVPIVPGAVIYDLGLGAAVAPDAAAGRAACAAAIADEGMPLAQGTVGAGTGATVGKLRGGAGAMKGGIGSASLRLPFGRHGTVTVGALVVVNAVGDICDPANGAIVAGARAAGGGWLNGNAALRSGALLAAAAPQETTAGAEHRRSLSSPPRRAARPLGGVPVGVQNGHDAFVLGDPPLPHTPFSTATRSSRSRRGRAPSSRSRWRRWRRRPRRCWSAR